MARKVEVVPMSETFYKWTFEGKPVYGTGTYDFSGAWQPRITGELESCRRGYHVCRKDQIPSCCGDGLHQVEVDKTDMIVGETKCVASTWRLIRTLAWSRHDMLDYAEWCLDRTRKYVPSCTSYCDWSFRMGLTAHSPGIAHSAARQAVHAANYAGSHSNDVTRCGTDDFAFEAGWDAERKAQLDWIMARIAENQPKVTRC